MGERARQAFSVIEASYAQYRSHEEWAAAVLCELRPISDLGLGVGLSIIRADEGGTAPRTFIAHQSAGPVHDSGAYDALRSIIVAMDERSFTATFKGPRVFMTSSRAERFSTEGVAAHAHALQHFGAADLLGVIGQPSRELVCAIIAPSPKAKPLSGRSRHLLRQVLRHVEMGARLRLSPTRPVAVLSSQGKLLAADSELRSDRRLLAERGLAIWNALMAGRWTLVPFCDRDGQRQYHVHESTTTDAAAFTVTERKVLEFVICGASGKEIGSALGLRQGDVSEALQRAALKLAVPNRFQLVTLGSALREHSRRGVRLTRAERDILDAIARGLRNSEIARERNTSEHTVANQVSAMLRKTSLPSRRALLSLMAGDGARDASGGIASPRPLGRSRHLAPG
jgi:DNA-binding NarL/FixJ family response regulator